MTSERYCTRRWAACRSGTAAAVILCLLEGLTPEQAAEHLGWPVGTVHSRLARGRERLRGRLSRRGLAPRTGRWLRCRLDPDYGADRARCAATKQTVTQFAGGEHGHANCLIRRRSTYKEGTEARWLPK